MKSTAPAFIASTASGTSPWPVMTMTGSCAPLAQLAAAAPARHLGHPHIGDDAARAASWQRLPGTRRRAKVRTGGPPLSAGTPGSPARHRRRRRHGRRHQSPSSGSAVLSRRRVKRNGAAAGLGSTQTRPPCASMIVRRDRQTHAHALLLGRHERLKQLVSDLFCDAGPGIGDLTSTMSSPTAQSTP